MLDLQAYNYFEPDQDDWEGIEEGIVFLTLGAALAALTALPRYVLRAMY